MSYAPSCRALDSRILSPAEVVGTFRGWSRPINRIVAFSMPVPERLSCSLEIPVMPHYPISRCGPTRPILPLAVRSPTFLETIVGICLYGPNTTSRGPVTVRSRVGDLQIRRSQVGSKERVF